MGTCFVPLCDAKNKNHPNRPKFLAPKDKKLFTQWAKVLPKVRTLRHTDKVCYLHFMADDVISTFDHYINGQMYKIKRDRPRLKPNAIPCLQITTEEELLTYQVKSHLPRKSKIVKKSDNVISKHQQKHETDNDNDNEGKEITGENAENYIINANVEEDIQYFNSHELTTDDGIDLIIECDETPVTANDANNANLIITQKSDLFNLLYDSAGEVLTPNTLWGVHRCPNRSLICFSYMNTSKMEITKIVCIKTDGSVLLFFDGNVIKTWQLLQDINDVYSLSMILHKVDACGLCFGNSSNPNCDIIIEANTDNSWITDDNKLVFLCKFCLELK